MLNKVWGNRTRRCESSRTWKTGRIFRKHKEVRQTTRKLHEDLRVHVLEQIAEIEGLRQHAENSKKDIQLLETRLQEETAKHSSFDELSAKVKVLEAENESLKTFIQESSSKETEARKELSEKHARDLAELNEKLERSQGRVISTVSKNKVLEAEAEAIDKLIFPSLGFEWSKESNLKRTEAYDEARISIDALFEACCGIAAALSLKKAKTTVIDTMTKLMRQVPDFIKEPCGAAATALAMCKAHFSAIDFATIVRGVPRATNVKQAWRKPKVMTTFCRASGSLVGTRSTIFRKVLPRRRNMTRGRLWVQRASVRRRILRWLTKATPTKQSEEEDSE
ncbi:hypothetical protein QYE76_034771 [Lolium multiflorum]|uniref:Uncharacterized protein n=1 Tax=Lolium multiflorum TaxID=4521 RepID=A0AAD8R1N4_LOLMU|nr:hypothetical protein QYE76_034771 [Lolium multiflorum]